METAHDSNEVGLRRWEIGGCQLVSDGGNRSMIRWLGAKISGMSCKFPPIFEMIG